MGHLRSLTSFRTVLRSSWTEETVRAQPHGGDTIHAEPGQEPRLVSPFVDNRWVARHRPGNTCVRPDGPRAGAALHRAGGAPPAGRFRPVGPQALPILPRRRPP